jgi:hypothetical protein
MRDHFDRREGLPAESQILEAMKRKKSLMIAAFALAGMGSCTYYDTPTAAAPEYTTGHVVTTLPDGYRTVTISGTRYYTYGDRYYRSQGNGYMVVDSPYGRGSGVSVVSELPAGYRVITRHGQRYYQVGDVYYQNRSGGYVIVDSPF